MANKRLYALADILFVEALEAEQALKRAYDNNQADTDRGNVLLGRVEGIKRVIFAAELAAEYEQYKEFMRKKART